jgi:hypothetical protein
MLQKARRNVHGHKQKKATITFMDIMKLVRVTERRA